MPMNIKQCWLCSMDIPINSISHEHICINIFLLVIVDASDSCHVASFNIGSLTTTTRKWDIRVTQYACGDFDMSGPPGCLQYYTGTAGNIAK